MFILGRKLSAALTRSIKAGANLKNEINKMDQDLYGNHSTRQNALTGPDIARLILNH